jgi:hypothetical protein
MVEAKAKPGNSKNSRNKHKKIGITTMITTGLTITIGLQFCATMTPVM